MNDPRTLVEERLAHNNWGVLSSQGYIMGLDVGSYGLRAALIDLNQHTYTAAHSDTSASTPDGMVEEALGLARSLLQEKHASPDRIVRIGIGFGGPVDARGGVVIRSPRMPGWEQYPLAERVEEAFGAVALVDNDANLIALAEATFGVGRGVQHLFYLHLSSGVGGGLVLDGRLYHGAATMAGEIGHAVVGRVDPLSPDHPRTLEQHLSIRGLLRRASELGLETNLLSDVFSDRGAGQQVVSEAVDMLAVRLSQIVALIDPQMVVLGGVVTRSGGERFLKAISDRMRDYTDAMVAREVPVVASVLGFESVAIGGLALALESMRE